MSLVERRWILAALGAIAAAAMAVGGAVADEAATVTDFRGMALKGYDPVAYFTQHMAARGAAEYELHWNGATWRFVSEENMARFALEPERYAPAFGGHCALGVAMGKLSPGDPRAWDVVGDRLYVKESAQAQVVWRRDPPGYINAARGKWPNLRAGL